VEEERPIDEKKLKEQLSIASLSGFPGWKEMKKLIKRKINLLQQMIEPMSMKSMIEPTDTPETVGFKYLIVNSVIGYLSEILTLPDKLTEVIKNEGK